MLLRLKAPAHPRTLTNDTPAQLAKHYGHTECYQLLSKYKYRLIALKLLIIVKKNGLIIGIK